MININFVMTKFEGYCDYCFDGIKNYDEEDIDCGGPNCPPCLEKKEYLDVWYYFIWLLWLLLLIILILYLRYLYRYYKKKRIYLGYYKKKKRMFISILLNFLLSFFLIL